MAILRFSGPRVYFASNENGETVEGLARTNASGLTGNAEFRIGNEDVHHYSDSLIQDDLILGIGPSTDQIFIDTNVDAAATTTLDGNLNSILVGDRTRDTATGVASTPTNSIWTPDIDSGTTPPGTPNGGTGENFLFGNVDTVSIAPLTATQALDFLDFTQFSTTEGLVVGDIRRTPINPGADADAATAGAQAVLFLAAAGTTAPTLTDRINAGSPTTAGTLSHFLRWTPAQVNAFTGDDRVQIRIGDLNYYIVYNRTVAGSAAAIGIVRVDGVPLPTTNTAIEQFFPAGTSIFYHDSVGTSTRGILLNYDTPANALATHNLLIPRAGFENLVSVEVTYGIESDDITINADNWEGSFGLNNGDIIHIGSGHHITINTTPNNANAV